MANFHLTMKIIGRSKGKSVIAASAYLNGTVMKNNETGKYSYYTSKKEVVYRQLMMCKNAPPEWEEVPRESIERFKASVRYKRAENKEEAVEQQVDYRSYARQGRLEIPTIHEGADGRQIEKKYQEGKAQNGSWLVAEN